jgi:hypothetical protein
MVVHFWEIPAQKNDLRPLKDVEDFETYPQVLARHFPNHIHSPLIIRFCRVEYMRVSGKFNRKGREG